MKVIFNKTAEKQLKRLPKSIIANLFVWITIIEKDGMMAMRNLRGYRDEALAGKRKVKDHLV